MLLAVLWIYCGNKVYFCINSFCWHLLPLQWFIKAWMTLLNLSEDYLSLSKLSILVLTSAILHSLDPRYHMLHNTYVVEINFQTKNLRNFLRKYRGGLTRKLYLSRKNKKMSSQRKTKAWYESRVLKMSLKAIYNEICFLNSWLFEIRLDGNIKLKLG